MRRNRCCGNRIGFYFAAFGLGMVVALICPESVVVGILAIAIVILGIIIGK
jgi:disulfide bond formation protein DsbB